MGPADFARFLESLSPDAEEAGRRYLRLHKKLVGFFGMRGVSDPADAANETIDRVALKIIAGAAVPDVEKYCQGFARNIAKERWRHEQREGSAFVNFIRDLADGSDEQVERIQRVLKPCFDALADDDRRLLVAYCQVFRGRARAEHRRRLAEKLKTTVMGLRMRVTRLRSALAECVERQSGGLASF